MDISGSTFDLAPNPVRDEALRPRRDRGPHEVESLEQYVERVGGDAMRPDEQADAVDRSRRYAEQAIIARVEKRYKDADVWMDWAVLPLPREQHELDILDRAASLESEDTTLPALQEAGGAEGSRS
jgi:hypothetical protein